MTTLTAFKQTEQLGLDELLAVIEAEETEPIEGLAIAGAASDPGRQPKTWARRLTKADATDPTIVALHPGEFRPSRRW